MEWVWGREEIEDWKDSREREVPVIRMNVKKTIRKIKIDTKMKEGEIVAVTSTLNDTVTEYAWYHLVQHEVALEMIQLDLTGYPHATGETRKLQDTDKIEKVAMWWAINKHYQEPYRGEEDIYDEEEERGAVIGPVTSTFPQNRGWYMEGRPKVNEHGGLMRLSDHTIHEMTVAMTDVTTKGVRPNCEHNWRHTKNNVSFNIPWHKVWARPTLTLADATESKAWIELLHRNWRANNRFDATAEEKKCRLGCRNEESMLHMITCCMARPLWIACFNFSNTILGTALSKNEIERAVIFNMDAGGDMLGDMSAAFMRHALSSYYTATTKVGTENVQFSWRTTYFYALSSFRDAVLRWAMGIIAHNTKRAHTNLVGVIAEKEREKFSELVTVNKACNTFSLTPSFQRAIAAAKSEMEAHAELKREERQKLKRKRS